MGGKNTGWMVSLKGGGFCQLLNGLGWYLKIGKKPKCNWVEILQYPPQNHHFWALFFFDSTVQGFGALCRKGFCPYQWCSAPDNFFLFWQWTCTNPRAARWGGNGDHPPPPGGWVPSSFRNNLNSVCYAITVARTRARARACDGFPMV